MPESPVVPRQSRWPLLPAAAQDPRASARVERDRTRCLGGVSNLMFIYDISCRKLRLFPAVFK